MYNLFVTADDSAWCGKPAEFDLSRCLHMWTDDDLEAQYRKLTEADRAFLMSLPCLFAYETACKKSARVGRLLRIEKQGNRIGVFYDIPKTAKRISPQRIIKLKWELGLGNLEMNTTHWALKKQDLDAALENQSKGRLRNSIIDLSSHHFDVSLSFPGEHRTYVESVAKELGTRLGNNRVFYDNFFKSQLARPNTDTLLQDIYLKRSKLIVAFVGTAYSKKEWCGLELRAIRELIKNKKDEMVMFVRTDSGKVEGVFSTDGYIDATTHTPLEVSAFISERLQVLSGKV